MSKPILGDTDNVPTTGSWANRAIAVILMLAVAVVGFFALWTLLNPQDEQETIPEAETEVAGAERPYPGRELEIGDNEYPLTISCVRAAGPEQVFVAILTNGGLSTTDYLVAVELSNAAGQVTGALAEVDDLGSGEMRETVLVPETDIGDIDACEITAVQGDRRVLLSR